MKKNQTQVLVDTLNNAHGKPTRTFNTNTQTGLRGWEYRQTLAQMKEDVLTEKLKYSKEQSKSSDGINLTKVRRQQAAGLGKLEDSEIIISVDCRILSGNHRMKAIATYEGELPDVQIRVVVLDPAASSASIRELCNRENRAVANAQTSMQILSLANENTNIQTTMVNALKECPQAKRYITSDLQCRMAICLLEYGTGSINPVEMYQAKPSGYLDISGALINVPKPPKNGFPSGALAKINRVVHRLNAFAECGLSSPSSAEEIRYLLQKTGFKQALLSALYDADLDDNLNAPARKRRAVGAKLRIADILENMARERNEIRVILKSYSAEVGVAGPRLVQILLQK